MGLFSNIKRAFSGKENESGVDVNKPVTNPGLKKAIEGFYHEKTEANLQLFVKEFKRANFLMIILNDGLVFTPTNEAGSGVFEKGSTIKFYHIVDTNDNAYYPLFTDWNEIDLWFKTREGFSGLISPAMETMQFILDAPGISGLVINPASDNWMMTREQIERFIQENKE